jgi:signal transduction protein with GAF and PtsI domain
MESECKISMQTFKSAVSIICKSTNLDAMANGLVQFFCADMNMKGSAIFFYNSEFHELEALATFGLSSTYLTKGIITVDKSFFSANLEGKISVCAEDRINTSLQYPEKAKKEGISSIVSVPIIYINEFLGVLRFYHGKPCAPTEDDIVTLSILGRCIGLAMTNNRLLNAGQTIMEVLEDVLPLD